MREQQTDDSAIRRLTRGRLMLNGIFASLSLLLFCTYVLVPTALEPAGAASVAAGSSVTPGIVTGYVMLFLYAAATAAYVAINYSYLEPKLEQVRAGRPLR